MNNHLVESAADLLAALILANITGYLLGMSPNQMPDGDATHVHSMIKATLMPALTDISNIHQKTPAPRVKYKPEVVSMVERLLIDIMALPADRVEPRIKEQVDSIVKNWMQVTNGNAKKEDK